MIGAVDRGDTGRSHSVEAAVPWVGRGHVLDLDDFSHQELESVFNTADRMREILARPVPRVPSLRGRSVVNLFYEPSTRTRVSFELAAKSLGADVVNVSASGSSVEKGETLLDTVRTLRALGANVLVVRHKESGAPYTIAKQMDIPVVNAGDGTHAHPTQALLDAYTIRDHFGCIEGLRVLIVGDIAHSRVARSDAWGLTALGADVVFCGPPNLLPATALKDDGECMPWPVRVDFDLDHAIENVDVVMPLRVQLERQEGNRLASLREYARDFGITRARLARAASRAIVMHPGPMNEGVEIDADVAHGGQSVVQQQVTNGVAIRMAVLYLVVAAAAQNSNGHKTPLVPAPGLSGKVPV
ncbi:MAG: aspartate carbamoyltransferase [Chloroflexi bacterium]|nr:aspartate carbamoyltransferase [Chloroflexota bacterium]